MQFNCNCLCVDRVTWLLEYANQRGRYRIRNCNQFLPLFCYHGNWFLLALIFIYSLLLSSLLLRILLLVFNFILLQHMNILYYVLYWSDGWLVGGAISFVFCMNVHCINFNVFVLLCVYIFLFGLNALVSAGSEKEWKKMISNNYLFNRLQPCTRTYCTEITNINQMKFIQILKFNSFVWDKAYG